MFDRAIVDFSRSYAEQNDRDYRALADAVSSGRIAAQMGINEGREQPLGVTRSVRHLVCRSCDFAAAYSSGVSSPRSRSSASCLSSSTVELRALRPRPGSAGSVGARTRSGRPTSAHRLRGGARMGFGKLGCRLSDEHLGPEQGQHRERDDPRRSSGRRDRIPQEQERQQAERDRERGPVTLAQERRDRLARSPRQALGTREPSRRYQAPPL